MKYWYVVLGVGPRASHMLTLVLFLAPMEMLQVFLVIVFFFFIMLAVPLLYIGLSLNNSDPIKLKIKINHLRDIAHCVKF